MCRKYFQEIPHDRVVIQYETKDKGKMWQPNYMVAEVIPSSISMFTGLTDKNGKKIFEGDIVNIEYLETTVKNAVIEYVGARFYGSTYADSWELDEYCQFEIIGNAHDNPELMEAI